MKKKKQWKKRIAAALAGITLLSSMPAAAQNLFTDGVITEAPSETELPMTAEQPPEPEGPGAGDAFTDGGAESHTAQNEAENTENAGEDTTLKKNYPVYTSPALAELKALAQNEAGAATETPGEVIPAESQAYSWFFQGFYVQEENTNYVTKNQEFLLKYQMEFYADCDLDNPFDVVIRIPKTLLWQQSGEERLPVNPAVIGVPRCEFAQDGSRMDIPSPVTPFNYYEETGADGVTYLVFYNYQAVQAGMKTAFQTVYGPVDVTAVEEGTEWSLTPTLQIQGAETVSYPALEGKIEQPEPTPTATPEATPTVTPEPTPTATPEVTPTALPEVTPTATPETTPTATPEVTPTAAPTPIPEYPTYDSMSIADLAKLDEETVGAATETPGNMPQRLPAAAFMAAEADKTWSFDTYYVGQTDPYHVNKTQDFTLKYQMEFHTDYDVVEPGDVEIRIPRALLTYRPEDGGAVIHPADIAVPLGKKNADGTYESVESRVTPFNYYVEGENLVFYNYKTIQAGTNAAWQVLYKTLDVSKIKDGTTWKLPPSITVKKRIPGEEGQEPEVKEETETTTPLTGAVHTTSTLISVTKDVLNISGKSYGPGLYTKRQVSSVLGSYPVLLIQDYEQRFENYVYVGWQVRITADIVQPVTFTFLDETTFGLGYKGEVVGYSIGAGSYYTEEKSRTQTVKVVTRYPKESVKEGIEVQNTFKVNMELYDTKEVQTAQDDAAWIYKNYYWKWNGHVYQAYKYDRTSYQGWLNVLEALKESGQKGEEEYLDAFPFTTRTTVNGYGFTHYIDSKQPNLGTRIPGTYYKVETIDGFYEHTADIPGNSVQADLDIKDGNSFHAYSNTGGGKENIPLTPDDYYIKDLYVRRVDRDYDVWEDMYVSGPEFDEGPDAVNQDIAVYAVYDAPQPNQEPDWGEPIAVIPWTEGEHFNNQSYYVNLQNEDGEYPVAIKTSYKAISYESDCYLDFNVQIKPDSPVMEKLMENDPNQEKSITVLNTARNNFGNIDKNGKENTWDTLYRSEEANVSYVGKEAASSKTARVSSDTINGRVLVDYNITAHTGFHIYSRAALNYLRGKKAEELLFQDLEAEGGKQWIFYDLLPYGMTLDFTKPVVAGRISALDSNYQKYPQSWDKTNVSVAVNPETDIIDNWKETGRTMVKFHLTYTGEDPTVYTRDLWMHGWGVSFRARYDWEDLNLLEKESNICAFTPERADIPLLDTDGVYENGQIPSSSEYEPFKKGIRESQTPEVKNILYAKNHASDDVAVASTSTIKKLVRADDDLLNDYGVSAVVEPSKTYTYDVTVTSGGTPTTNIVIYDRLEYAVEDRTDKDTMDFGGRDNMNQVWTGTFAEVDTRELEQAGIEVKVYYSKNREAARPRRTGIDGENQGYQTPEEAFEESGDWTLREDWTGDLAEVKAVAVDIRKKENGQDYELPAMKSIGFKIKMRAPAAPETDKPFTYNNPAFYSKPKNSSTTEMVVGNSVRVELKQEEKDLEIIKEFQDKNKVPEILWDEEFEFVITYPGIGEGKDAIYPPFSYQVYTLYQKDENGEWNEVKDGQVRTTDKEGKLILKAGEKAIFKSVRGGADLLVSEVESPFWESRLTDDMSEDTRSVTFSNRYRPVLYIQKQTQAVPADKKSEVKEQLFAFRVASSYIEDGKEIEQTFDENTVYWLVDRARTDGGIPQKLGEGKFDSEGFLFLKEGQVAAVFLDNLESAYKVTEDLTVSSNPDDWLCDKPEKEGIASLNGSKVEITNTYRWKDLILLKEITHQDAADVEPVRKDLRFTFEVKKVVKKGDREELEPVVGKKWILLNSNGSEPGIGGHPDKTEEGETVTGTLDEQGRFTCAMANRRVKIKELEAGATYVISEIDYQTDNEKLLGLYKPVNGGTAEVTMPVYSTSKEAVITNDYQMRPLTVSKQVLLGDYPTNPEIEAAKKRFFTMTVSVNGKLLIETPYELFENGQKVKTEDPLKTNENGQFSIKDGQSAYFKDAGFLEDVFEVKETPDPLEQGVQFEQLYPPNGEAFEGVFAGDGGMANFINGTGNRLVVMKEYIGGDEEGQKIAGQISKDDSRMKEFEVEAEFVFYDEQGELIQPLNTNKYNTLKVLDLKTGEQRSFQWIGSSRTLSIQPGKMYIIPEEIYSGYSMKKIASYQVTEKKTNYGHLYREETPEGIKETWIHIQQKPKEPVKGTLKENPVAKLINEITVPKWEEGTLIEKRMAIDANTHLPQKVTENSVLTLRLEQYHADLKIWLPAQGIPYLQDDRLVFDGKSYDIGEDYQISDSDYKVTGADGLITCVKSKETYAYPVVWFPEDNVFLNLYREFPEEENKKFDKALRLVEVPELSDPAWGYLTGYGKAGTLSYSMDETEGTILYNRTGGSWVEIEKAMATDSDETFTMLLKQVLSQSVDQIDKPEHIQKSQAVPGIPYTVYDRETNGEISQEQTGKNGEIYLQAGQFARLELSEDTRWTVEEQQNIGTTLEKLDGKPEEKMKKLSENLMLIHQPAEAVKVGTITYNANGGRFGTGTSAPTEQRISYYMDGETPVALDKEAVAEPRKDGEGFDGWYTNPDCTEEFQLKEYDCEENITVYAKWRRVDVKYAVALYGIEADGYEGEETDKAGLTFGPATGENYVDTYKAHLDEGTSEHCIHWDSWTEIIEQSQKDPTVYQYCLQNACTKAVELELNDLLLARSYPDMKGDGASVLDWSLYGTDWNETNLARGGWPASGVRAVLNGTDSHTDPEVAGENTLTQEECLLSCFPKKLQEGIVAKKVVSDTESKNLQDSNQTTYDKLWLFSIKELVGAVGSGNVVSRPNEGEQYERLKRISSLAGYRENGKYCPYWLRSLSSENEYSISYVNSASNSLYSMNSKGFAGIAPGFCIR